MDVWSIAGGEAHRRTVEDLPALLADGAGLVWVDVLVCDERAVAVLSQVFGFHPLAVQACVERNLMPKVHAYDDHVFVALHAPEPGHAGHVHYVEIDQFVGSRFLVSVHGPLNPAVEPDAALHDTRAVLRRVQAGRLRPANGFELSYAVVSALARRQEAFVESQTRQVWHLEQRVTAGHLGNPETFLEEMFRTRHGLVAVRTMAALSREIYGRMATVARSVPAEARPLLDDIVDQFSRVYAVADGQKEYLQDPGHRAGDRAAGHGGDVRHVARLGPAAGLVVIPAALSSPAHPPTMQADVSGRAGRADLETETDD